MSKKTKRQTRSTPRPIEATPGASTPLTITSRGVEPTFNPDYSQTIKDLKRIGILAGTFFTVLIVLSFFLR